MSRKKKEIDPVDLTILLMKLRTMRKIEYEVIASIPKNISLRSFKFTEQGQKVTQYIHRLENKVLCVRALLKIDSNIEVWMQYSIDDWIKVSRKSLLSKEKIGEGILWLENKKKESRWKSK